MGLGIGAGVAALAAAIGADPLEQFAVVAVVLAVSSLVFLRGLLPADAPAPATVVDVALRAVVAGWLAAPTAGEAS